MSLNAWSFLSISLSGSKILPKNSLSSQISTFCAPRYARFKSYLFHEELVFSCRPFEMTNRLDTVEI